MKRSLIVLLLGLSGMTALIYEIIWIRPLSLVFGTTVFAVSTIISSFIFGLAIGSWIAGRYSDRVTNPLKYFALVQVGIGFYGIALLPIFGILPPVYLELYRALLPNHTLFFISQISLSFAVIAIPAILMGTTLPLMMRAFSKNFSSVGFDVGKLDAANSAGAVLGTLAAGFLMIPILGIQTSVIITAIINLTMGVTILSVKRFLKLQYPIIIVVVAIFVFSMVPNYDIEPLTYPLYQRLNAFADITVEKYQNVLDEQETLFYQESLYGTVTVTEFEGKKTMKINGKNQCGFANYGLEDAENLAKIPFFVYELNYGKEPKTALNVGLGCGTTSYWFGENLDVTTVEIDPTVIQATSQFFDKKINHELIVDDGRIWLLKTDKKFDIITGQPNELYDNHGNLFTKEYFELQKKHLNPGGIASQWIPLYSMTMDDFYIFYNTFNSVFPHVDIYKNRIYSFNSIVLVGSETPLTPLPGNNFVASGKNLIPKETVLNTDDRTVLETTTAMNLYSPNRTVITESFFFEYLDFS